MLSSPQRVVKPGRGFNIDANYAVTTSAVELTLN